MTKNSTAQIVNEGLKRITALYRIESQIRAISANERFAARKEQTARKVAAFKM